MKSKTLISEKPLSANYKENLLKVQSSFHYYLKIEEGSEKIILGLHQEDEMNIGVSETRPNIDIGIQTFPKFIYSNSKNYIQ